MSAVKRFGVKLCKRRQYASPFPVADRLHNTGLDDTVDYSMFALARPREGCGPLCVFDGVADLIHFFYYFRQCGIWNIDGCRVWACVFTPSATQEVWATAGAKKVRLSALPPGTVLADDVLLVSEIPIDWPAKDDERAKRNTWSRRK